MERNRREGEKKRRRGRVIKNNKRKFFQKDEVGNRYLYKLLSQG